jgi:hypothetical protein
MPERKVVVALSEADIQRVEQAAVDQDGQTALELIVKVIKPQVDAALYKGHCKPAFELEGGADLRTIRPPPTDKPG